jgi:hypothetical protein
MTESIDDLKQQCGDCHGSGRRLVPCYGHAADVVCCACNGAGFTWTLTQQQMAERIGVLEAELEAEHNRAYMEAHAHAMEKIALKDEIALLRAENARLKAPVNNNECVMFGHYLDDHHPSTRFEAGDIDRLLAARAAEPFAHVTDEHKCPTCGEKMERKCFMSGATPIQRCRSCEYAGRYPYAFDEGGSDGN